MYENITQGHIYFSFGRGRTPRPPKFCKKAFRIKTKRRRNKEIMHQGNFFWKPKEVLVFGTCFNQGQDGELRKGKKVTCGIQKINGFRSELARSRQTLPRGHPEPGQWPCTQILWDRPYWPRRSRGQYGEENNPAGIFEAEGNKSLIPGRLARSPLTCPSTRKMPDESAMPLCSERCSASTGSPWLSGSKWFHRLFSTCNRQLADSPDG